MAFFEHCSSFNERNGDLTLHFDYYSSSALCSRSTRPFAASSPRSGRHPPGGNYNTSIDPGRRQPQVPHLDPLRGAQVSRLCFLRRLGDLERRGRGRAQEPLPAHAPIPGPALEHRHAQQRHGGQQQQREQ